MANKKFEDYVVAGDNITLTYDNNADTVTIDAAGNVDSVNGQTGVVVLTKTDIGLGNVTNVDTTNATNISSGTLGDARLSANVTLQGNTFNAANKLVQLDGTAKLPAVDGSQLTNLPTPATPTLASVTTAGNTTTNAITVGKLNVVNTSTTIAPVIISGTNPFTGGSGADYFVINGTGNVGTTLKTDVGGYVAHRFFGNNVELGVFYCGETNKEFVFKNSSTGYIDFQTTSSATSRLRIFNNGNVGIGTTTDAGYKLDVNGTARVQNTLDVRTDNLQSFKIINTSNVVLADIGQQGQNSGIFRLFAGTAGKLSGSFYYDGPDNSNAAYGAFGVATSGSYFGTTGGVIFSSSKNGTGTQLPMIFGGYNASWSTWMQIRTNGNVLINTTTDAGYKLDVNGTARFQRTRISNSNGNSVHIYNDGTISFIDSLTNGNAAHDLRISAQNISFYSGASYGTVYAKLFNTGNFALGSNPTDAGFKLDVNGTARIQNVLTLGSLATDPTGSNGMIYYNTTTNKFRGYENGAWANII